MYIYVVYMLLLIDIISVVYLYNDLFYEIFDNIRIYLIFVFFRVSYFWGVICIYEINLNFF